MRHPGPPPVPHDPTALTQRLPRVVVPKFELYVSLVLHGQDEAAMSRLGVAIIDAAAREANGIATLRSPFAHVSDTRTIVEGTP